MEPNSAAAKFLAKAKEHAKKVKAESDKRVADMGPDKENTYYHVTTARNAKKIKETGLIPQHGKRSKAAGEHKNDGKPASYLFKSRDEAHNAVGSWLGDEFGESTKLHLLRVDVPHHIKVHHDPAVGYEHKVHETIPPHHIRHVEEL